MALAVFFGNKTYSSQNLEGNMETAASGWIPNLILGQDYDKPYQDELIHYDALENLATFFGRDMAVHRHANYVQIHFIDRGAIEFQIDDQMYHLIGPALILTPPSVPHSFYSVDDAQGHVLTLHQSLVWQLFKAGLDQQLGLGLEQALCVDVHNLSPSEVPHWRLIVQTLQALAEEWQNDYPAKHLSLQHLVQLLLIQLSRLNKQDLPKQDLPNDDLQIFRRFNNLVQDYYQEHWHLNAYVKALGISASRLHQACQRTTSQPPKKIIHERLIQEAKRLLTFTQLSSAEICYQLGFSDPAYFSRFFKRATGQTAQSYRKAVAG